MFPICSLYVYGTLCGRPAIELLSAENTVVTLAVWLGIILGELTIHLDWGSRLFGSYARTPFGVLWRVLFLTGAALLLAMPGYLDLLDPDFPSTRQNLKIAGGAGWIFFLHFLFPYQWGIVAEKPAAAKEREAPLVPGLVLREISWKANRESVAQPRPALRALVLTDLHVNSLDTLELLKRGVEKTPAYDVTLLLGDFGEKTELLPPLFEWLGQLPAPLGKYVIRGNHDCEKGRSKVVEELSAQHGLVLLDDQRVLQRLPDQGTALLGTEIPFIGSPRFETADGIFTLGLSHSPDNIFPMAQKCVPLVLAGHTHGGFFKLPGLGAFLVAAGVGRFVAEGWFRYGSTWMFVSRGIGYFPSERKPGEVVVLTLE